MPNAYNTPAARDLSQRISRIRSYLHASGQLTRPLRNLLNGYQADGSKVSIAEEIDTSPPPPIAEGYLKNLETLKLAAANGDLALVSARYNDGRPAVLLSAIDSRGALTPFATMIDGNPYEMFQDPTAHG